MNEEAYKDGYERGLESTSSDVTILERAIRDCIEMEWLYLKDYFQGQLDAINGVKS